MAREHLEEVTAEELAEQGVVAAPNILAGTPQENKQVFDRLVAGLVAPKVNEIVRTANLLLDDESLRDKKENDRQTAETARDDAEAAREEAEAQRVTAEEVRAEAEDSRAADEAARREDEIDRAGAESERAKAEIARESAENDRDGKEVERQTNETERKRQETLRRNAEQAREDAEAARQAAEEERQGAVGAQVAQAQQAANRAENEAKWAISASMAAGASEEEARKAAQRVENMTAQAQSVDAGTPAAVEKTVENGAVKLLFSIPKGETGAQGPQGPAGEGFDPVQPNGSILIGTDAVVPTGSNPGISIGKDAISELKAAAVGSASHAGLNSVALGHNAHASGCAVAVGFFAETADYRSVAVGPYAKALSGAGTSVGYDSNAVSNGVALGCAANAASPYGTAVGPSARCAAWNGIALGSGTVANGPEGSIAIGYHAACSGCMSMAIGPNATEIDGNAIRLGQSGLSGLYCAVSLSVTSDIRDKAEVEPLADGAVALLEEITPIRYVRNARTFYVDRDSEDFPEEEKEKFFRFGLCEYDRAAHTAGTKKGERKRIGVSAQEVLAALEQVYGDASYANLVNDNFHDLDPETIPDGVENQLTVSYEGFVPILIKAVQELSARIKELEEANT